MEQMGQNIGFQFKKIRQQRGQSLDAVAKLTGVSKAQLSQIEKGECNPTVSTIWKIASGWHVSFSSLLQPPKEQFQKYDSNEGSYVEEELGHYRVYSIIPYSPERGWELFKVEMDEGVLHKSEAHIDGVEETVTVIKGSVVITAGTMEEQLTEGQILVFSGEQAHSYKNIYKGQTVLHLILQYR